MLGEATFGLLMLLPLCNSNDWRNSRPLGCSTIAIAIQYSLHQMGEPWRQLKENICATWSTHVTSFFPLSSYLLYNQCPTVERENSPRAIKVIMLENGEFCGADRSTRSFLPQNFLSSHSNGLMQNGERQGIERAYHEPLFNSRPLQEKAEQIFSEMAERKKGNI